MPSHYFDLLDCLHFTWCIFERLGAESFLKVQWIVFVLFHCTVSNTFKIKLRSNLLQQRLDLRSVFRLSHEEPLPENPFWKVKRSLSLWRSATAHALIYRWEILLSFLPFIFPDPFIRLSSTRSKLSSLIFHTRWRKRQRKEREWMILLGSITATNGNFSG